MDGNLLKTGASSILLGPERHKGYISPKTNKLLKITRRMSKHDEFIFLPVVRQIKHYEKYYCIPDNLISILKPSDSFYRELKNMMYREKMKIFDGPLECYFINYAGNKDIFDAVCELDYNGVSPIWKSWKDILHFIEKILLGLGFLHDKKLCHLDIKCENIVVNMQTKEYRIIDFGFCAKEPFDDYVKNIRGTPGYFPKHMKGHEPNIWLPRIYANDMVLDNFMLPMARDRKLVYKIDSFCFGRVINMLFYVFNDTYQQYCFCYGYSKKSKICSIINDLLKSDVHKRLTVKQCLIKYF